MPRSGPSFRPARSRRCMPRGSAKALLAQMTDDRLSRYIATAPLDRFTVKTLTDPAALRADLQETRARGFAIDDEEKTEGMRCIAAPVFDWTGEAVAGVSVSGPVSRVSEAETPRLADAGHAGGPTSCRRRWARDRPA